jgi:hypothetical protein
MSDLSVGPVLKLHPFFNRSVSLPISASSGRPVSGPGSHGGVKRQRDDQSRLITKNSHHYSASSDLLDQFDSAAEQVHRCMYLLLTLI